MKSLSLGIWWLRIVTFSVAALAAASATYWVLKWNTLATPTRAAAPTFVRPAPTDPLVVARLLGGGQSAVVASVAGRATSRFKLTGVVADRTHSGYALISIDGQAAKPYRVGAPVNDNLVLQSVAPRSAALAAGLDAPVSVTLELPNLSAQSAETRPAQSQAPAQAQPQPQAQPQSQPQPQPVPHMQPRNRARGSTDTSS